MADRVFVDTNVLVYLFDEGEPEKQARAIERIAAEQRSSELVVSTQILNELYNALTRGQNPIRLPEEAEAAVRDAANLTMVQVDPPMIFAAISKSRRYQISFWDALVVQAAEAAGCTVILTEDLNHDHVFGTVRIENPFVAQPPDRTEAPKRRKRKGH